MIPFLQLRNVSLNLVSVTLFCLGLIGLSAAADVMTPTFSKDVAPILFAKCVGCHRPGEIASDSSLLSYEGAYRLTQSIKRQVVARQMPPWPADPRGSVKFRNDARLSQPDIDTLVAWVDAGAPKGNDADLPAEPIATQQWLYPGGRAPDAVVTLPQYTVKSAGVVPYIRQLIKVPYARDRWIVAMQVRAGNRRLLHHMGITEVELPNDMKPDDIASFGRVAETLGIANGAFAATRAAVIDPARPSAYDMLGVYTPGTTFEMYADDTGRLLKGGSNLYMNFNIHYTATGAPESDRSQIALWFAPSPPTHQLIRAPAAVETIISNGRELLTDDPGTKAEGTFVALPPIPAYAANYELIGMEAYTQPVTIYQFQPHAHMRAKDFTYAVIYPDGSEKTVLTVPQYDFHWQLAYELDQPLELPAGSKLVVTAHYDNSVSNDQLRRGEAEDPSRRCSPEKVAYFGQENQSWDEMFSPLVQYSTDDVRDHSSRQAIKSRPSRKPLNIVRVVGCLSSASMNPLMLTRAGEPSVSAAQSTSLQESRLAAAAPLGRRQYELLGTAAFAPVVHAGRKVAVKGVLIHHAGVDRINTTSLQDLASTCR